LRDRVLTTDLQLGSHAHIDRMCIGKRLDWKAISGLTVEV